jgi:hypothetical protein
MRRIIHNPAAKIQQQINQALPSDRVNGKALTVSSRLA